MTAKEALLQRVQALSEEEAEALLRELPAEDQKEAAGGDFWDRLKARWAAIPIEEWEGVPQSSEVDQVVYGLRKD